MLELLGSQVLEGSLVLAEAGRIKESQRLGDPDLCLRAKLASHSLAGSRLLCTNEAQHRSTGRGRGQRRVGAEARLSLHSRGASKASDGMGGLGPSPGATKASAQGAARRLAAIMLFTEAIAKSPKGLRHEGAR